MSRRSLLIIAVLAVAGLFGVLASRRQPPLPPPPAAPRATAFPEPRVEIQRTPDPEQLRVFRTETGFPPVDENGITSAQAAAAAARYRQRARFPRTSRPLESNLDPINTARENKVPNEPDDRHPEPRLVAYPSIASFAAPEDVVIYAEIVEMRRIQDDQSGRDRQRRRRAPARSMRGVVQTVDGVMVAPIGFFDDGTHGDAEADDDFFTATFTPDPDRPNDFRGQYQVVVQAESARGDTFTATTSFIYSVQTAHLTGHYRDALVNGNLQIDAEVEVEEAGRFRLEGTLVKTADANMVGYAHTDVDLGPGTAWVPLTYYGLIFHTMKAPGPYSLFSTVLSTLGGPVPQESDVVPNAHTTKAYAIADFGDQPFNDPEYIAKAEHLEEIARAKKAEGK